MKENSMCSMNSEKCNVCYFCESGVKSFVSVNMLKELHKANQPVPDEWLEEHNMINQNNNRCFSCEKCYSGQNSCDNCYTCEKCFSEQQNSCDNCYTCEKCFSGQESQQNSCENCFSCEKCYSEQNSCDNCFSCERCYQMQEGQMNNVGQRFGITYFIFLTNECNLRCTYCYATKSPPSMDKEMIDRTVKFIVEDEEKRIPNRDISIQFFGGEPTIKWDLLVYFVEQLNREAKEKLGRKIRWGMTTNGTLLNEERLKYLKSIGLTILLSLDGRRETHDKHRVYANGKGSWGDIPFDLILKYYGTGLEIRPTILPDTIEDWYEDLMWFHSKGCYVVATEVAYEADWNEEAMEKARKLYNKLGDKYIEMKDEGKKFWMKFIDDARNFLGVERQTGFVCGIGRNSIAIDARGDLFACQRYAAFDNPDVKLGSIYKGFDNKKLVECNDFKREYQTCDVNSGFDCNTCPALWKCRGGCNAMNYQCNGDRKIILENHCKFQRLWAEIALRVLASTGELWNELKMKYQRNR